MPGVLGAQISLDLWFIVKIMFMVGMALYCIFAFVVTRQVGHMTKTLEVGFETPIRLLAIIHLIASLGLFVFALLYL
jgi:hypothetical protein